MFDRLEDYKELVTAGFWLQKVGYPKWICRWSVLPRAQARTAEMQLRSSNLKRFLVFLTLFAQSTGASGQTSPSQDEGCLKVSNTVAMCVKETGRDTWAVVGVDGQLVYLPNLHVRIDVHTMPYDPEWDLHKDEIASKIAEQLGLNESGHLRTFGDQGSFQDWGHVRTFNYEMTSTDDTCFQFVTYHYIGDGEMVLISSHYCGSSSHTYGEVEHYDLLGSIEISQKR
jgi:hypothetical protein